MAIFFLSAEFDQFPDPGQADESGLLAVGGNLAPETLLKAYRSGIFPWYNEDEPICWFCPGERCVIFPDKIKISKSMQQLLKKQVFTITRNQAFDQVIEHCAGVFRPDQDGTWIVEEMQAAYKQMHTLGHASSIEVWQGERLVGGLYGIEQGAVFCGESMFSLVPNASKAALIHLCTRYDYKLIDCQVENPHLMSMGAELLPRQAFLDLLERLEK
ncbi:MAG: leucyl/phenylalanyl-tRNA--protein transferase [Bacteroidetes bacterium 43-16]|nr:MAG: leucyl/phenylalanyl-tRNA--protein transferase [Bacteroidetes bacterium 43-16]